MATLVVNKLYAVIDKTTELVVRLKSLNRSYNSKDPEPKLGNTSALIYEELTSEVLGGLSPYEFVDQNKPVIVSGAFSSWASVAAGPAITLVGSNLIGDASNHLQIDLSGGPADVPYKMKFSRNISRNGSLDGTLDGSGGKVDALRISVFGQAILVLTVYSDQEDFKSVTIAIPVDNATYV